MISNFNYGSLYSTNKDFYSQMSNNLEQYDEEEGEEENIDIIKRQQMHSKKQAFLYDAPSVQNLESFNLDQHLDMNRYSIDFASGELNNREITQMTNSNQLDDCLAIDCNLESYSSLSSSSSTSSSTTSLSSSNKNDKDKLTTEEKNNNNNIINVYHTKPESDTHKYDTSNIEIKNKKLNSLIHGNRKNTQKSKNKHLKFASVESLSCDEGYVGSYSDTTTNFNMRPPKVDSTALATDSNKTTMLQNNINRLLCPQDQLELLKFLLDHTFNVILEDQTPQTDTGFSTGSEYLHANDELDSKVNQKEENSFFIPPIYSSSLSNNNSNECEFENLLNTNLNCSNPYYQTEFDIVDNLQLSEQSNMKFNSMSNMTCETEWCSNFDDYSWTSINTDLTKAEKLKMIQKEINQLKEEQERMDQEEMMTNKWRFILEKKRRLELRKNELESEDKIDAQAYLNEIEMNLDYFTHEDLVSDVEDYNFSIDQMLRFKENTMAFNLRSYHKYVLDQQTNNLNEKTLLKNKNYNMFANFHVDLIQEFVPVPTTATSNINSASSSSFSHEPTDCEINSLLALNEMYPKNGDEDHFSAEESHHQTLNEEEQNKTLVSHADENGTLCCIEYPNEQEYYDEENGNYEYYNEEDYEDYEDQLLIDSLTEEEALALLRSESEMYALQMSQAAKLGILMNEIKRLELGTADDDTCVEFVPSSTLVDDEITSDTNNNDIFENVFEYEYCNTENTGEMEHEEAETFEDELNQHHIEPHPQYEQEYYEDVNDTVAYGESDGCTSSTSPTSYFNSNVSLSLRNSLLKLRHSRRHLASLIETNKNSSSSSATSSLNTNSSSMSLYKQHMLTMQSSSKKPCVYMLTEGRCARSDCRFVHDLKTIMCKYWLEGECLKGENCEFLHEIVVEEPQASSRRQHKSSFSSTHSHQSKSGSKRTTLLVGEREKIKAKKIEFKLDTEEFPALGGFGVSNKDDDDVQKKPISSSSNENVSSVSNTKTSSLSPKSSNKTQQLKEVKATAASFLFSNIAKTKSQTTKIAIESQKNSNVMNIALNKQQQSSPSNVLASKSNNSKQTGTNLIKNSSNSIQTTTGEHKSRVTQANKSKTTNNNNNNNLSKTCSSASSSTTQNTSKNVTLNNKNLKSHLNSESGSRVSGSSSSSSSSSRQNSSMRSRKK